ncbi:LuxR family transcriptional regulator [Mesorhizobium sp. CAU 1741]|uniref:helix-turn-helix transcriptional regulator n=1 Tax=Mesorhizobium sp. CAU 1741 TaxID=3140366 RepID=UPI00325A8000
MRTLQDIIVLIQSAGTKELAFQRFNAAMEAYGYDSNVYTLITDHPSIGEQSTHGLVASYPQDWLRYYNANQFQRADPVWQRLLQGQAPFFWGDILEQLAYQEGLTTDQIALSRRVMAEAAEAGVADGIGISFVSPLGEIAAVGLSRTRPVKQRRLEEMAEIYLLSAFFHEKFMSFYPLQLMPHLTPRERDVLNWAAENMTDNAIGDMLGVTTPTVRFHWKNIFEKLGVSGRVSAVAKAVQLRLIIPAFIGKPYQGR